MILLFTISCKKDDLPAATQEGKNTMAAKINGKVWSTTACFSCIGAGKGINASYEQSFINLGGEQKNENTNIYIQLYFKVSDVGSYTINGTYGVDDNFIRLFNNNIKYKTSKQHIGTINVTKIDRINKILSGTFNFSVQNENDPTDVLTITDGIFDIIYN